MTVEILYHVSNMFYKFFLNFKKKKIMQKSFFLLFGFGPLVLFDHPSRAE